MLKVKIFRILQKVKKTSCLIFVLRDIPQLAGFITHKRPSLRVLLLEYSRRFKSISLNHEIAGRTCMNSSGLSHPQ